MTVIKEVKVGEVSGAALDYLVLTCGELDADSNITTKQFISMQSQGYFLYSTDWEQGGPIITQKIDALRKRSKAEEADLTHPNPNFKFKAEIFADIDGYFCGFGPTPLIAVMRCYVASKLGEVVKVPQELL